MDVGNALTQGIQGLYQLIVQEIVNVISGVPGMLETIALTILDLPGQIVQGIKEAIQDIFIPDAEYIETRLNEFANDLKLRFNIDSVFFDNLFGVEKPVQDVYMDYAIPGVGSFNLKIFDTKYLIDGVSYFRPLIRGFMVLMMVLYNIRQIIGFFGYDAGVVTGRNEKIAEARKG